MKTMRKIVFLTLVLLSGHISASTITWGTAPALIGVNDVFTINVIGTGFVTNVDGGGVNISYNSSVLNVLSVSINEAVWDLGVGISSGTTDNVAGTVDGIMVNAWSAVTGDFSVASIQMQAIGAGDSYLSLSEYGLNPWASGGALINPSFVDSSISVEAASPVPVPAAVWLFGSGLIGLISIARKKK